ncbi:flagellin [Sulfurimonas sp. SAG-AH-194-I05]|nr:flagellin [Sulfurimonas sp. SAG-AH-194-I05]MDF1875271.1 flagellin [Sulfurimonas sp. SAG-AH-194-I05]
MGFSINTNIGAMNANLNLNQNNQTLQNSLGALSSGTKLGSSSNDAASLSIANGLSSYVREMSQSIMNANDSIGMIQIADGAMSGISENMDKIRDLTLRASNGTMNSANRMAIQKEIDGLMKSTNQMSNSASYNGIQLLSGSDTSLADTGGIQGLSINVLEDGFLEQSLEAIDGARGSIDSIRSDLGASQNGFESQIRNTSVARINAASAESNLRDVDFAQESANFSQANIKAQIGSYVQAQSNAVASNVTRLFQ